MKDDLETMLRASLQDRADDVEPTPELWRQVDRRVSRRRALPLFVWTAAGVAAVVAVAVIGPGLLDRVQDGLVIDPAQSPSEVGSPTDAAPGPVAAAPLSHYVAVVDGRLVLRGLDGSEGILWEGESEVRTVAVRPGTTADEPVVAAITTAEGMVDLRILGDGTDVAVNLGPDAGDAAVVPTPVWSPDGSTVAVVVGTPQGADLVLLDPYAAEPQPQRMSIGDLQDPSQLRVQDWTDVGGGEVLSFTALGVLYRAPVVRVDDRWAVDALGRTDGDEYVVDIATASDGMQYRLLAGGSSSGDAEDAGLALEFDNERVAFPDLATASPADAWMTAVDGGAIVGLGSDARLVVRDPEGDSAVTAVSGVSYAQWVPGGTGPTTDPEPVADGTAAAGSPAPFVAIDEEGRVAVHTGDGGEREVILDEQLWAPEAAVRVSDVSVRPGSSAGEVSGVALLATEAGPELAWFRAAAGATATARMEGPFGLGAGDTDQRDAPTFSPDGRHVAWTEPDGAGGWTLRTVGMADDGPTDEDATFGLDLQGDTTDGLRVVDWTWLVSGDRSDGARGLVQLVSAEGDAYRVMIERQGDGALAVAGSSGPHTAEDAEIVDLGMRGSEAVTLLLVGGELVVRQPGAEDALLPLASPADLRELDLDVSAGAAAVTYRGPGAVFVVDLAGEVAPLDVGRPVRGFDPVR